MKLVRTVRAKREKGFTIVELLVVAPVVVLTIGAFVTVIVNMTGDVLAARTSTLLAYNVQSALNTINADVALSSTFLAQTNLTEGPSTTLALSAPQGYGDDTTAFNNVDNTNGNMLVLNMLATTANPLNSSAAYVFLNNLPNSCTSNQASQNTPMTYNIVYFVKNNTLWRRVLLPSNYATAGCNIPWQQPSCNPTFMTNNPGAPIAFCKTKDQDLLDNISTSGFNIQYFNTASATTPNSVASDVGSSVAQRNAALQSLTTIGASISVSSTAAGRPISQSGAIRSTRLGTTASTIAPASTAPTSPGIPTGLVASGTSTSQLAVSWYAPSGPPSSYTLQYSAKEDMSSVTTISNITSANTTISGLSTGTVYFIQVKAVNSAGTSTFSAIANGTTQGSTPWSNYTNIAAVGDWNKDGKNDIIGYKANGDIELRLGNGNATFGGIIALTNIGTTVRNFIGPGTPTGLTAPVVWWDNTSGAGFMLKSDGALGLVSSTPLASGTTWNTVTSVFAAPKYVTANGATIIGKAAGLTIYSLGSTGALTGPTAYGSGWDAAYPGDRVFGLGDFNSDGFGDIAGISSAGAMTGYPGTGTGTTGTTYSLGSGWTGDRVTGGWDYTGDGKADVLRFVSPNTFYVYQGSGANAWGTPLNYTVP
ncbi:fibronectin type III domain-containing protein [Patescibacteria group bacterium]|nr:MAG: fibronectin type III domain-containing protein [Patescibacteria group bacterium]